LAQFRARTALPHVAAIDGLRALAVLAVVAYHATLAEVPGGFFGVDVFFVISGYLVTVLFLARASAPAGGGLAIPEVSDTADFWRRRARRLLPATLATAALTWVVFAALGVRSPGSLTAEALAAVGYIGNWFFLFGDHSYFETISSPSPFLHFWSLAVEAQFYLVWPLLLIGALRFGGRLAAFALAVSLAAISTLMVASLYSPEADPSRAYYGTDARVAGLLLGAALAIVVKPALAARVPRAPIEAIGWGGLAALVLLTTQVSEFDSFIYRGGFFAASCASVAVMLAALHERNTVAWMLSRPALRWLGERSYSIYLWHWPVFVLTQPQMSADLRSWSLLAARLGLTLILAELSYRLVENTFRGRSGWRLPAFDLGSGPYLERPWARPAGVVAVGLIAIVAAGGMPLRIGLADDLAAIEQQVAANNTPTTPSATELAVAAVGQPKPASTAVAPVTAPTEAPSHTSSPENAPGEANTPTASTTPPSGTPSTPTVDAALAAAPAAPTPPPNTAPLTEGSDEPEAEARPTEAPSSSASASSGGTVDGVTAATPSTTPDAGALGASVTIIGDSVALGALTTLQAALPGAVVDAEVGRQFWTATGVIAGLDAQGALGEVVVVSLGSNGTFTSAQFEELMAALGDRTVLFVTATVPRRWEGEVNASLVQQSATRGFGIVDWHSASSGVAEYFGADGVHLTAEGRDAYAALIAQAVRQVIAARG
jgi:peptidoglycan/LPS O-acetylase OafA/YrhL